MFAAIGIAVPPLLYWLAATSNRMSLETLLAASIWLVLFLPFAAHLWLSIPERVFARGPAWVPRQLATRRFVLILWASEDYNDFATENYLCFNKDVGGDVIVPVGWDQIITKSARSHGLDVFRVALGSELEVIGLDAKGKHVRLPKSAMSQPGSIKVNDDGPPPVTAPWQEFILAAMHAASAIVLLPGSGGDGFRWERAVVARTPDLQDKAIVVQGEARPFAHQLAEVLEFRS